MRLWINININKIINIKVAMNVNMKINCEQKYYELIKNKFK